MTRPYRAPTALLPCLTLAGGWLLLAGCQSTPDSAEDPGAMAAPEESRSVSGGQTPTLDAAFLLQMDWQQAKEISAQHLEVAPFFRVAASEIQVLKTSQEGRARKARARGRVYVEMNFTDTGRVLCQEALVNDDELILRGRPVLQRGGSLIEGLDDGTVFYMLGPTLRVIGRHRITNQASVLAEMETGPERVSEGGGSDARTFPALPSVAPALPAALGAWLGGPNPLLPPLTPSAVPEELRLKMRAEAENIDVTPLSPTIPVQPQLPPPLAGEEKPLLLPVPEPKADVRN